LQELQIIVKEIPASKKDKGERDTDVLLPNGIDRTKSNVYYQTSDGFSAGDGQSSCVSFSVTLHDIPRDSSIQIR
jgi:hypothetical protein